MGRPFLEIFDSKMLFVKGLQTKNVGTNLQAPLEQFWPSLVLFTATSSCGFAPTLTQTAILTIPKKYLYLYSDL